MIPIRVHRDGNGHLQAEGDGPWAHLAMFLVADLNGDRAGLDRLLNALETGRSLEIGGNVYDVSCGGESVCFHDVHHDTAVVLPADGVAAGLRAWRDAMGGNAG